MICIFSTNAMNSTIAKLRCYNLPILEEYMHEKTAPNTEAVSFIETIFEDDA